MQTLVELPKKIEIIDRMSNDSQRITNIFNVVNELRKARKTVLGVGEFGLEL